MKRVSIIGLAALALTAVASAVVMLNRRRAEWDRRMRESSKSMPHRSPYSGLIAEKLLEHHGEPSPILHAFEEALEAETRLERQLARETGLEA